MTITEICAALEALENAREKATAGPWVAAHDGFGNVRFISSLSNRIDIAECTDKGGPQEDEDKHSFDFIVSARNCPISFRKIAEVVRAAMKIQTAYHDSFCCESKDGFVSHRELCDEMRMALAALEVIE